MNYTGLKFDGGLFHKECECKVIKQLVDWDDVYKAHQDFGYSFKKIQDNYIVRCCGKNLIWSEEEIKEMIQPKLQESIRRILREELSPRIRRRISYDEMEKEFLESFESAYDLTKKRRISQRFFKDEVIYSTIVYMMDSFHPIFYNTLPENEFWYDDIFNDLKEHYEERIIHMYNERRGIKESMKRILREETAPSNIRRRTKDIDTEFEKTFGRYYIGEVICERYDDANMYLRVITEAIIENLYWHTFYMEDDTSEEWARAVDFIYEYIKFKYGKEVKEYYNRVCKGNEY